LIERSTKEVFLQSLEDWINEVVKDKADGHNDQIAPMIKEGFDRSMRANIDYHKEMADRLAEAGETTLASYHAIMSDVYRLLLVKARNRQLFA